METSLLSRAVALAIAVVVIALALFGLFYSRIFPPSTVTTQPTVFHQLSELPSIRAADVQYLEVGDLGSASRFLPERDAAVVQEFLDSLAEAVVRPGAPPVPANEVRLGLKGERRLLLQGLPQEQGLISVSYEVGGSSSEALVYSVPLYEQIGRLLEKTRQTVTTRG